MDTVNIFNLCNIFAWWLDSLKDLWGIFNTHLGILVDPGYFSIGTGAIRGLLNLVGLYNVTLLEFCLGSGLAIYIGWQLAIWLFNLVT